VDATMVVLVSSLISAIGAVTAAWIQARGRRPRKEAPPDDIGSPACDVTGAGLAAGRETLPDDRR
jgi:hypothetical protein